MQTLYLIRHTTPDIAPGICYGQLDMDVAASFPVEAAAVTNWLPPFDLLITSPLLRTQRLAEHLAQQRQCALRSDARLMEMHFGSWEGRAWNDIERSEIDAWGADILNHAPPAGESARQMLQRVQTVLREVSRMPQRSIGLVAHGGSIRAVLALLAGVPLTHTLGWKIDYGAVMGVRITGGAQGGITTLP